MISVILTAAAILALIGIDQAIKLWAIANLQGQPARPFLQLGSLDWMHLRYMENSGAAFSMLSGSRGFLVIFAVIMSAVCLYILNRFGRTRRWVRIAMPLVVAGGLGNVIDRLFRGGRVVDYLDFQLCNFAVFNFADICVTVGVGIVIIGLLFLEKEVPEAKKLKPAERIPYAHTAAPLDEAGTLPDAGELPEAEAAPLREAADEVSEDAGA